MAVDHCPRRKEGSFLQRLAGLVMILVGALILILFVPFETWLAVVGVALILGGIALRM